MSLYVFPMKISSLHWNSAAYTCKEKLWRKVVVSIKCCNLHSFKERVILLCQSILEMRRIPHSYGPALFTIPLKICLTFFNLKLQHINSSLTYKKNKFYAIYNLSLFEERLFKYKDKKLQKFTPTRATLP